MKKLTVKKFALAGSFVGLCVVTVALVLAVGMIFNKSFGWFSINKTTTGTGMSVRTEVDFFELKTNYGLAVDEAHYTAADMESYYGANEYHVPTRYSTTSATTLYRHHTNAQTYVEATLGGEEGIKFNETSDDTFYEKYYTIAMGTPNVATVTTTVPAKIDGAGSVTYFAPDANGTYYLRVENGKNVAEAVDTTDFTDHTNSELFCVMLNETPGRESNDIAPGSFGKVVFSVIPKKSGTLNVQLAINVLGIKKSGVSSSFIEHIDTTGLAGGELTAANANNEIFDLLQGHILLFDSRTQIGSTGHYNYSGRIGETFNVTLTNAVAGTEYPIEFYWIWPLTFGQIVLPENDARLRTHALFGSSSVEENSNMRAYIYNNQSEFVYNTGDIFPNDYVYSSNYVDVDTYFNQLSNGYNNGDQHIGDNVQYVVISVDVSGTNPPPAP